MPWGLEVAGDKGDELSVRFPVHGLSLELDEERTVSQFFEAALAATWFDLNLMNDAHCSARRSCGRYKPGL